MFKVGDVVVLRSGGPFMTVEKEVSGGGEYWCHWFGPNGDIQGASFKEQELKKIR